MEFIPTEVVQAIHDHALVEALLTHDGYERTLGARFAAALATHDSTHVARLRREAFNLLIGD